MILSDKTLKELIDTKELVTNIGTDKQIQCASVDIRLADSFLKPSNKMNNDGSNIINLDDGIDYDCIKTDKYILLPGQFVLGSTIERFKLPCDISAFVEGRSTYGRLGLFIQNAGWVDPGFEGEITLELYNANQYAIELVAGKRIGQMVFARMDSPALNPYLGKYQFQSGATGSKVHQDVF